MFADEPKLKAAQRIGPVEIAPQKSISGHGFGALRARHAWLQF